MNNKPVRVLLVAEGEHERSGALENLVRKLGGGRAVFDVDRACSDRIHIHAVPGKGKPLFKRALRWLLEAEKRGLDALVLLIDQDGERDRCRQIADAQDNEKLSHLPRAMGVAIETFDAWMLADEKALTRVLGHAVPRQPDPETIRDPKGVCAGLLGEKMAQREMYAQVALRLDIDILTSRCTKGFKPFARHVRRMFGQEECS
jgi:hypothetical protein